MTVSPSPVADCECVHPFRLHTRPGLACEVESCTCLAFKVAESKLSHVTHCYCCGRVDHVAQFCPYVKGQKARGDP